MFKSDEIDKDWGKTWIGAEVVNSETLQIYTSLDIKLYSPNSPKLFTSFTPNHPETPDAQRYFLYIKPENLDNAYLTRRKSIILFRIQANHLLTKT